MKKIILITISLFVIVSANISCRSDSYAQSSQERLISNANYSINSDKQLLPAPKGLVNDFANIFDQKTKEELEQTLVNFQKQAKIDFAIVTVKTTGDKTAFDYSLSVARDWGVGAKPDGAGVLLLIAVEDKHWHIQITRVLEKILSNAEVGKLGALMQPYFRKQEYGEGATKCVSAFIKVLKERRGTK